MYWSIGTPANFNIRLTHFDAAYFAFGTLSGAGTGSIVTTSSASRGIQALQMIFDMIITLFLVGLVVGRVTDSFAASARDQAARDGDAPH